MNNEEKKEGKSCAGLLGVLCKSNMGEQPVGELRKYSAKWLDFGAAEVERIARIAICWHVRRAELGNVADLKDLSV